MNKHIIVVFGASGSGKDTLAKVLYNYSCLERKFARPMKKVVEEWYGLKPGTLDTQEGKAQKLTPESDKTFSDLLVGFYHFWQKYDDGMTARVVAKDIEYMTVSTPWNIVVTDMRKLIEAKLVCDIVAETKAKLHVMCIVGRGTTLSTDEEQPKCLRELRPLTSTYHVVKNDSIIDTFLLSVDNIAKNILT